MVLRTAVTKEGEAPQFGPVQSEECYEEGEGRTKRKRAESICGQGPGPAMVTVTQLGQEARSRGQWVLL